MKNALDGVHFDRKIGRYVPDEPLEAPHEPPTGIDPSAADLSAASIKGFLKLVESFGLTVQVKATLVTVPATVYLSKSKTHNVGDPKTEEYVMQCVFITATDLEGFAVQAAWNDGKFANAFIGGEKSGHRPPQMFTQTTKTNAEIKKCLT